MGHGLKMDGDYLDELVVGSINSEGVKKCVEGLGETRKKETSTLDVV